MTTTTTTTTTVDESPSFVLLWRMNGYLRYGVAMISTITILTIAVILYIATHKITIDERLIPPLFYIGGPYLMIGLFSFGFLFEAIEHDYMSSIACKFGHISHTLGFLILLCLVYSISHNLAIHFGLPCLIWFVPAMFAPWFYPSTHRDDSEEKPQSAVDFV